ncbi:unnamed protein product [Urochloa decumbens]|uniref:BTB domain-containing protein n=1 Tax=Urochloa decumbens TaxID=240449 RepID=A0ABC9EBU8_9POAL
MQPAAGIINLTEAARSVSLLKINGHSATAEKPACKIASMTVTVGGHDWVIDYYPSVQNFYDKQNYIMIRITLASDATGVVASFSCRVVDHAGGSLAPSAPVPATGTLRKGEHKDLQVMTRLHLGNSGYLKDDSFLLECVITVLLSDQSNAAEGAAPAAVASAAAAPAMMSDLHKHFGELWRSKRGTDVTFLVAGEDIAAHKCVLAARSPVFMAELFGDMKETASRSVVIEDMEPEVFKALVQFIYTDTSPLELEQTGQEEDAGMMAQHLIAAADRYGMERLKLICEEKVCGDISVSTAATLLVLAEQHGCPKLKAMCMEFIVATPANLRAVVVTDGYKHLMASCPSVLSDFLVAVVQRNK